MSALLHRLFGPATCPGCGREYVQWTDFSIHRGYRIERRWHGCPAYRDIDALPAGTRADEARRHGAYWTRVGKETLA